MNTSIIIGKVYKKEIKKDMATKMIIEVNDERLPVWFDIHFNVSHVDVGDMISVVGSVHINADDEERSLVFMVNKYATIQKEKKQ